MKIFTILKCLIRFLNLFTILKFLVDVLSVMWRKFPLTEVVNIGRTAAKARSAQGASQKESRYFPFLSVFIIFVTGHLKKKKAKKCYPLHLKCFHNGIILIVICFRMAQI